MKKLLIILFFLHIVILCKCQNADIVSYREMLAFFVSDDTLQTDCNNEEAITIFNKKIKILEKEFTLKKKNKYTTHEEDEIISNLEFLTGIESNADGDFFGRHKHTVRDVTLWKQWFYDNKEKICLHKKTNIIFLNGKQKGDLFNKYTFNMEVVRIDTLLSNYVIYANLYYGQTKETAHSYTIVSSMRDDCSVEENIQIGNRYKINGLYLWFSRIETTYQNQKYYAQIGQDVIEGKELWRAKELCGLKYKY